MSTPAARRQESLPRLLWVATARQGFPLIGMGALIFVVQAWIVWHTRSHTLDAQAEGFRWPVFWLGVWIQYAIVYPTWAHQRGFFESVQRELLNRAPEPAEPTASAGTTPDIPDAMLVAQPILAGLSASCLGFALGLHVIATFSPDRSPEDRGVMAAPMYIAVALLLASAMYHVARSTRRLYGWSQEAAAAAAKAEADASRARVAALQAQMNPHFLFNALNTVASLLGTDGARAKTTVQNLSGMLTHTLQRSARPLTTVDEELRFVRGYLAIERERFGSRLDVTYDIDPATSEMTVPTMSLQPLVENAIKHAVTNRLEGGHIRIAASTSAEPPVLRLSVEDDGSGFVPGSQDGTGLGNLRARLKSLYGASATLRTETLAPGARVTISIPNPSNPMNPTNLKNLKNLSNL